MRTMTAASVAIASPSASAFWRSNVCQPSSASPATANAAGISSTRAALEAHRLGDRRPLPGGEAEQQRRGRPQGRHQGGVHGEPERRLVQEEAVDDGAGHEAGAHQQQRAAGSPSGQSEDAHDEAEQEQVAERVRQVDRDDRVLTTLPDDRAEHERGRDRRRGQRAHQAVEPEARPEVAHALPHEQHDRDVAGGVEGQPQSVADAGQRRLGEVGVEDRVVDLAARPGEQSDAQHEPRGALARHRDRAGQAQAGRDEDQAGVDVLLEERVGARAAYLQRALRGVARRGRAVPRPAPSAARFARSVPASSCSSASPSSGP